MLTMFPEKMRALVVDNDAIFLKSFSTMLSLLNFKVTTCKKPDAAALTLLMGSKPKDVDVLLIEAEKAAASGFDFRGIVEPNLSIPVIYYYHEATGDKVDGIRRKLRAETYTIRKPLDLDDVRYLWRIIAWRKFYLQDKPNRVPFPSTAELAYGTGRKRKYSTDPGSSSGGGAGDHSAKGHQMNVMQGQERVNLASQQQPAPQERRGMEAQKNNGKAPMFQQAQAMDARQQLRQSVLQSVLRAVGMPQYNPRISADATGPSNNVATGAGASNTAGPSLPVYPPAPAVDMPQYNPRISAYAAGPSNNVATGAGASNTAGPSLPVYPPAPALDMPQYNPWFSADATGPSNNVATGAGASNTAGPSLPVYPPAPALDMPQYNPRFSADATGPSNNVATGAGASNTAGPSLPVYPPAPAPAPTLPPVNQGLFPAQAPPPLYPTPPPARTPVYPAPAPSPPYLFAQQSRGAGPTMLNFQQPQAGDLFTGMPSGAVMTFRASAIAQTGACNGNTASSLLHDQSLNPGADNQNELSAMVTMYSGSGSNSIPPMAPQHVGDGPNEAAIATLYNNNYNAGSLAALPQLVGDDAAAYEVALMELEAALNSDDNFNSNYSAGSHMAMAPDQVFGMASNVNELTMAGRGAFGGNDVAASSVAPQDLVAAAPNGTQVAPAEPTMDDIFESLTGPHGPDAAMDGNADDNFTLPLEYLMGLLDNGDNDGASATNGTNTTQIGGDEQGMGIMNMGAADNLGKVGDFSANGTGNFMFPRDVN